VLRAGEVRCRSAGTAVVLSEFNEGQRPCRLLQFSIEPGATGIAPAYAQKAFAVGGAWTPLLDPGRGDGLGFGDGTRAGIVAGSNGADLLLFDLGAERAAR
jgi:hypothetical protein